MPRKHCELGVATYPFDLAILEAAVDTSFEREISVYDAYLIALAKNHRLTLVTADEKLFAKVKDDGTVLRLNNWS